MSIIHPHFTFPEDVLPVYVAMWWRDNSDLVLRTLTSPKYHKPLYGQEISGNLLIYPPENLYKGDNMNGRKPKRPSGRFGDSDDKPAPFQWINIALTSEDFDTLEREEASIEQLALAFVQLGVRGLGLAVKFNSARKSFIVSIYGSDSLNNNQPCGISGTAPDLRDALLVSLYRFNNRLQSSFDGQSGKDTVVQSRRFG